MSIIDGIKREPQWLEEHSNAIDSVLYLFSEIRDRFEMDEKYGEEFVKKHPEVIATLVNATIQKMNQE